MPAPAARRKIRPTLADLFRRDYLCDIERLARCHRAHVALSGVVDQTFVQ
jgi:hypothetical protein